MKSVCLIAYCAVFMFSIGTAKADETETVQTLLSKEFAVVGVIPSPAGPGLFLQKKAQLFVCFVTETPGTPAVTTRYCKPVQ